MLSINLSGFCRYNRFNLTLVSNVSVIIFEANETLFFETKKALLYIYLKEFLSQVCQY